MTDHAHLFTASWTSLWQASKDRPLPVVPVRISKGVPKFWPAAERFPAVEELMPPGWVLGERDDAKALRGYRGALDRIGIDRILARLDAIAAERDGASLALVCFEADPRACHRSWAAAWLREQTGVAVPEVGHPTPAAKTPTPTSGRLQPEQLSLLEREEHAG